jgi:hypothetical protein
MSCSHNNTTRSAIPFDSSGQLRQPLIRSSKIPLSLFSLGSSPTLFSSSPQTSILDKHDTGRHFTTSHDSTSSNSDRPQQLVPTKSHLLSDDFLSTDTAASVLSKALKVLETNSIVMDPDTAQILKQAGQNQAE